MPNYRRELIRDTVCPECGNSVLVFLENDFYVMDMHVRRNPFNHNLENCPNSRSLVTSRIREHDIIVAGKGDSERVYR